MANIGSEQILITMAAFSTASQAVTETVIKTVPFLNKTKPDDCTAEGRRQLFIHAISAIAGYLLFWQSGIDPFAFTTDAGAANLTAHQVVGGFLCSFGSKFFNDLLGIVNSFKVAKSTAVVAAKQQLASDAAAAGVVASEVPATQTPTGPLGGDGAGAGNTAA